VSVDNPDEETAQGPSVSFTVAEAPPPPPKSYRMWFIVALALVLILAGVAIWLVLRRPEPANFAGSWSTNFAQLDLKQDGARVSGEYRLHGSSAPVKIEGTVEDRTMSGVLDKAANTTFRVTIDPATRSFNGTWGANKPWCGVSAAASALPEGCSFTGQWTFMFEKMALTAALTQTAKKVAGTIDMGAPQHRKVGVSGEMKGWVLEGELTDLLGPNSPRMPIRWTPVDQRFQQFYGIQYELTLSDRTAPELGVSFEDTCGFRQGASIPSPCRDPSGIVLGIFTLEAAPGRRSNNPGNGPVREVKVEGDFRTSIVAKAVTTKPGQLVGFGVRRAGNDAVWVRISKTFWDAAEPRAHVALHQRLAGTDSVDVLNTLAYSGDTVHFMIERRGDKYTLSFSPDGKSWKSILGKDLDWELGSTVELYATVASDVSDNSSLEAEFSNFSVNKP
jgi:hypothetical protein